ncbi:MAG: hypothetical protein LBU34_15800, partial [Planctomycetaceae bacterium]|nr:hypothetical protein [Planctomycetaceae bacterium]
PKEKPENIPDIPEAKWLRGVPGEKIGTITIPPDVKPNTLQWINGYDFQIVPLCNVKEILDIENNNINFTIVSNLNTENSFRFELQQGEKTETKQDILLKPDQGQILSFKIDIPAEPQIIPLKLIAKAGDMKFEQKYQFKSELGFREHPKLPEHFETGYCQRGKEPTAIDDRSGAHAYLERCSCGAKTQRGWAIHPPYQGGVGYTFLLSESITVPKEDGIAFSGEVGIRNGGAESDGVLYRVFVAEPDKEDILAGEILWAERNWKPFICDLSAWQGKTIRLRLIADVGTKNNSSADWAAWANFKLVSTKQALITTLTAEP